MKRSLALLKWKLPVIWIAGNEQPAQIAAAAETASPPAVVNHYHLHLEPGADALAVLRQLGQSGTVVPEIRE